MFTSSKSGGVSQIGIGRKAGKMERRREGGKNLS
jgi:hypothetical protein